MRRNANPRMAKVADRVASFRNLHGWRESSTLVVLAALCLATLTPGSVCAENAQPKQMKPSSLSSSAPSELTLADYLDRLMMAESGGRDNARSKTSTALGPFQFIGSTFLHVVRRHLPQETIALKPSEILALRTNRAFARRAAEAYTKDNAYHLATRGHATSFVNLRLAYLVGPTGAAKVLRSKPSTKISSVLSASALKANPFMSRMTVADLIAKCARDLSVDPQTSSGIPVEGLASAKKSTPQINVKCSLARPSCQRWLSLAKRRLKLRGIREARK
jgi:hypothetical protein